MSVLIFFAGFLAGLLVSMAFTFWALGSAVHDVVSK